MKLFRHTLTGIALTAALGLAACGAGEDQTSTNQPATSGTTTSTAARSLTADQVDVQMTLKSAPVLSADGQFVDVTVGLANHGKTTLISSGLDPVNLGAHSVDAQGKIVDHDLARASLPDAAPGTQVAVTIQLPVDKMIDNSAQILPVQEGIAWFDHWGTKPLVVGPFKSCTDATKGKLCDADGKALSSTAAR